MRAWRKRLARWWAQREPVPADQVRLARQARCNSERIDVMEARQAAHEARTAAKIADMFAMLDAAAKAAGASGPDLEATLPGLYLIPGERQAG